MASQSPAAEIEAKLSHWRELRALHQPKYEDLAQLEAAVETLRQLPPLVFAGEIDKLKGEIAKAGRGQAFILQGGDCAETFKTCTASAIKNKIRTILQMAIVLTYGASLPVVKIGRMAGQYAKPRSSQLETRGDVQLPSYLGDAVNDFAFTPAARVPDPARLLSAYHHSASTLNLMRAFCYGGFADLHSVHDWNHGFNKNPVYKRYEELAAEIDRAIGFMKAAGSDITNLQTVDFYSSHEALLLAYEDALTRVDQYSGKAYNYAAHFLWIGERTRQIDGAHVEILRHVENPIGVKIGPGTKRDDLLRLADILNPSQKEGRLTFITRMGAAGIKEQLPPLIETVKNEGRQVTWMCDPMHGNTITASTGYKTRRLEDVLAEVHAFFDIHRSLGTIPAGLHVELTGDDVTEIIGGSESLDEAQLARRYETLVDPRLNHQQALELAFDVADMISHYR